MATYTLAVHCSHCNEYFKHIGGGTFGQCNICKTPLIGKMVEKYSEQDPNRRQEFVGIGYKDTPRYSVTLGVSETQIEEAKKLSPQCDWKRFGSSYRPLIKNRAEKLKLMRQCNYEEYDPKDFKGRD